MKKETKFEVETETDEKDFAELGKLQENAPDDVLMRLQKRMRMAQLGKDLIERQAFAFWAVLDAFLKMIFVSSPKNKEKQDEGEK